jgi:hypothetical protein
MRLVWLLVGGPVALYLGKSCGCRLQFAIVVPGTTSSPAAIDCAFHVPSSGSRCCSMVQRLQVRPLWLQSGDMLSSAFWCVASYRGTSEGGVVQVCSLLGGAYACTLVGALLRLFECTAAAAVHTLQCTALATMGTGRDAEIGVSVIP